MDVRTNRFRFDPFWQLTRWGFLFTIKENRQYFRYWLCGFSVDEFHNRAVHLTIPLVGMFVFFYSRHQQHEVEHISGMTGDIVHGYIDDSCSDCAEELGWYVMQKYRNRQRQAEW